MTTGSAIKNISNTLAAIAGVWLVLALVPATRGPLLTITEHIYGGTLPIFPNGDCRIKNSDLAARIDGSIVVLGEVVGVRRFGKNVWAIAPDGRIVDEVCPPEQKGCSPRQVFAVIDGSGKVSEVEGGDAGADVMIGYEMSRRIIRAWF